MTEGERAPSDQVSPIREPSLVDGVVPLVALVVCIAGALLLFDLDALDGPIQAGLLICCMIAALVAMKNGHSWSAVMQAAQNAMTSITTALFILLAVGALIGVLSMSGTFPTMVYWGIQVLAPSWYYAASALFCGVIALSIGSSWTTAGTIGVGLVSIATLMGVSPAITAGRSSPAPTWATRPRPSRRRPSSRRRSSRWTSSSTSSARYGRRSRRS